MCHDVGFLPEPQHCTLLQWEQDVSATDVSATDVSTTDVSSTDVSVTDVSATDVSTTIWPRTFRRHFCRRNVCHRNVQNLLAFSPISGCGCRWVPKRPASARAHASCPCCASTFHSCWTPVGMAQIGVESLVEVFEGRPGLQHEPVATRIHR